jgi:hypothetical protein
MRYIRNELASGSLIVALSWCSLVPLALAADAGPPVRPPASADVFGGFGSIPGEQPELLAWPLVPSGKAYAAIDGKKLWRYVQEQADISRRYRDSGHPQYWGRIVGTSSDVESAEWLLAHFKRIGLTDVHNQTIAMFEPQWVPDSWEVTAHAGAETLNLTSATPPYGAADTDGKVIDLPVAYVGLGSEADFVGRDVRGKAVLLVREQFGYQIGPNDILKRAQDHGAAAIFGTDLRGGNYKALAYRTNTGVPTFNLGTEDGLALREMIGKAPADGPPRVKIRLAATWDSSQKTFLSWGTLPGATNETVYVIAHRDGWYDAAGDNASGVALMLGLAEHFAKVPRDQRRRTVVFIGLDGHHHTPGSYGRDWMFFNRDKFFGKTALFLNAEHPAQILTHSGARGRTEQTIPMWWHAGSTTRPQLTKIALGAFREFGVPLWTERRNVSGDLGPYWRFTPGVVIQSSDFMHMHTDGDSPEIVSWTGLESATRAYARIVDEVNKLDLKDLQRPPELEGFRPRIDPVVCAEWVKDSSLPCKPKK